jgi:signal transduction histidine kinase
MWRDPIDQVSSQLLSRTTELNDHLRLLDAIVLQMPDALAVFDGQGHLVTANPSMTRWLLWHKQISDDEISSMTLADVRQALGFDPMQPISPASLIHITSPKSTLYCLCTESSLLGPAALPLHMLRIHDITPLRQQEEQRQKTLAFLSHDMRTPVAAIAAVAERLARQPVEARQIIRSASDIVAYTERLMAMMDGFIDYSQATLAELNKDVHLLSNLLDDALAQVKDLAEQQNTRFVLEETDYPLAIECDAHLVVRALVNTLVNALHHGQTGGQIWVNTSRVERQTQGFAVVQIRNTVGEEPRDPMVRGFGLGLEFVRMVMARHGGTMQASWWDDLEDPRASTQGCATLLLELPNVQLDPEIEG